MERENRVNALLSYAQPTRHDDQGDEAEGREADDCQVTWAGSALSKIFEDTRAWHSYDAGSGNFGRL